MKTKKTILVEKEVVTWKCDFCDKETEHNHGCCGSHPIQPCDFCGKDACRDHRNAYWESPWSQDHPDFHACQDCIDKVDKCEHIARTIAGRHDIWWEVVRTIYRDFDQYQDFLKDYEPKEAQEVEVTLEDLYETDD